MLTLEGLDKQFGAVRAVDGVSLSIGSGQFVGVIGRSGAGKSTLLRLINRLIEPSAGRILWDGTDVTALRGRELLAWRASCGMIFQQFHLVPRLDVITNVMLGRLNATALLPSLIKRFPRQDRDDAIRALHRLDVVDQALQRAETLSGGQMQRVAIARALMQRPRILLADEPIASLDPRNATVVMEALRRINREDGITVLANLHTLDTARAYCDRLIAMARGKVVFDGPPERLTAAEARAVYGVGDGGVEDGAFDESVTSTGLPVAAE
jgi:phosphonate transport system ATP-binding protein